MRYWVLLSVNTPQGIESAGPIRISSQSDRLSLHQVVGLGGREYVAQG
jgi:hypothetical protein